MPTISCRAGIALLALALGCARGDRAAAAADSLLRSTDSVAVYNAGVAAFKAKDYATARRFWKRAMDLHDNTAISNLGFLFYYGLGGEADSVGGADMWQYAAYHRVPEAHVHLARVIADGDARAGTMVEAYSHAVAGEILAAASEQEGDDIVGRDASALKADIAARLTAEERSLADFQGRSWAARTPQ